MTKDSSLARTPRTIFVAGDHAGFGLKKILRDANPNLPWEDLGTYDDASVDYPDFAHRLADRMKPYASDQSVIGILICGSGQGVAMGANRHKHIRAALCWSPEVAKLSRSHNNANVLCLPAKFIDTKTAQEILTVFLNTEFEGGRHERRVAKLSQNC